LKLTTAPSQKCGGVFIFSFAITQTSDMTENKFYGRQPANSSNEIQTTSACPRLVHFDFCNLHKFFDFRFGDN